MPCFFKVWIASPFFPSSCQLTPRQCLCLSLLAFLLSVCQVKSLPIFASMDVGVELRQKGKGLVTLINYSCWVWVCTFTFSAMVHRSDQRHLLRDRRRGTTACPACWAMGTNEVKKCTVRKKVLYCRLVQQPRREKHLLLLLFIRPKGGSTI